MSDVRLLLVAPPATGQSYVDGLRGSGFAATYAASLGEAVRQVVAAPPDAVLALVDAGAALQICEVLRAVYQHPLILAGQALPPTVAASCLDKGADAIVALPLPVAELVARIRAVQRRIGGQAQATPSPRLVAGDLTIDLETHAVAWRGTPVELSPTEFKLLSVLAEAGGRVVTNRELLTRVWGDAYVDDLHYVRLYIGYLRAKLRDDPAHPQLILNQWGVGYRLAVAEPVAAR